MTSRCASTTRRRPTPIASTSSTSLSVSASEGTPDQYETEEFTEDGIGYERIKIGDPDRTISGEHTYDIRYRVKGALNGFEDHDELYWNAIGAPVGASSSIGDRARGRADRRSRRSRASRGRTGSTLAVRTARPRRRRPRASPQSDLFPFNGDDGGGRDPEGRGARTEADPRGALDDRARVRLERRDRRRRRRPAPAARRRLRARCSTASAATVATRAVAVDQAFGDRDGAGRGARRSFGAHRDARSSSCRPTTSARGRSARSSTSMRTRST